LEEGEEPRIKRVLTPEAWLRKSLPQKIWKKFPLEELKGGKLIKSWLE